MNNIFFKVIVIKPFMAVSFADLSITGGVSKGCLG